MRTIYLECNMGAAGDMLMSALLELHPCPEHFIEKINAIGIPNVEISYHSSVKCGITGTHVSVVVNGQSEESADVHDYGHNHSHEYEHSNDHHDHEHYHHDHSHDHNNTGSHEHSNIGDIEHIIKHLHVSETVKNNALAVYELIAQAESHSHDVTVSQIHFHEVGTMDAVADIVGVCMLMEELAPEKIIVSPIHVGSGHVRCSHGILPVPTPATLHILRNIPIYSTQIKGELCTPTGAALLKHFADSFEPMPVIKISSTGYGMGKKDFDAANCVRAILGDSYESSEYISELVCNIDDMTPESLAFAQQLLFDKGALDVYTIAAGMKKGRTGFLLTCMCKKEQVETMRMLIFKHTTTLGIREYVSRRYGLRRKIEEAQTPYGSVRVKKSEGYGVVKTKPEYEDVAKIAKENGLSICEVIASIR